MAKVLGITDAHTDCDCCGKTNLKRTVVIELDGGSVSYFGTSCAAGVLNWDSATVTKTANSAMKQMRIERERFISQHPLTKLERTEFQALRNANHGIRPSEWMEISKEYRVKWRLWQQQVKNEAEEKFKIS